MKISTLVCLLGFIGCCLSSKLGLIWTDEAANLAALAGRGLKTSWIYTYRATNTRQQEGLEFVPMLWGPSFVSEFQNAYNGGAFSHSKCILGPNEPDLKEQANLSPEGAASFWIEHMQPLGSKFRLGAPAVSNGPQGKQWLQQFFSACHGCKIDFIPLHWYGNNWQEFAHYVTDMHNTFKKNIWITEFACQGGSKCNQNFVYNFMGATTKWLDEQPWVERYAWQGASTYIDGLAHTNYLLTPDGHSRSGLGNQYAVVGGHA